MHSFYLENVKFIHVRKNIHKHHVNFCGDVTISHSFMVTMGTIRFVKDLDLFQLSAVHLDTVLGKIKTHNIYRRTVEMDV